MASFIDGPIQILPLAFDTEWSESPGVVELFPGLSSPNRTCTSQRIRLSIQVLLNAKATSAYRDSINLRFSSRMTTSPACLAFHRLSKVFTSLRSVNPPSKPLKLPPFAMWPAFPTSDYYGGSVNLYRIGGTLPWHRYKPSPVHMLDSTHGRGCLSQSFSLLAASRRGRHGLATRSPWLPAGWPTCPSHIR